ncbi:MAG: alpha/beta fold hydrolase [Proteobacteria bacterium]|nr:MAG: alpha/beta fold hydrolase [Pseudomonadota bacterium]
MSTKPGIGPAFSLRSPWTLRLETLGFSVRSDVYPSGGGQTAVTLFEVAGSEKLLLLAHGTGNDHFFTLQDLIEESLTEGWSVLTLDLPGHGRASSTLLTEESFRSAGEDLKAYLSASKLDSRKLYAAGYSLGGVFWLRIAEEETLTFTKLALLAVPLRVELNLRFVFAELCTLFSPSFYRQWLRYGWRETVPAFGRFRRKDFPLRLAPKETLSYPAFIDKILSSRSPLESVAKLSHNCLVIFGGWDRLAKPKDFELWQKANPGLTRVVVDRANHFLLPFQKPTIKALIQWMKS